MKKFFNSKPLIFLALIFVASITISAGLVFFEFKNDHKIVRAGTGHNVTGFAWSENIGWISFNCTDDGTCGSFDYGVAIDSGTGNFSGYAWSENVGWISFQETGDTAEETPPDNYIANSNCPNTCNDTNDCTACYDSASGNVYGWAKILSLGDDGWVGLTKESILAKSITPSRISQSYDDAEERISDGLMRKTSSDLEFVRDDSDGEDQIIGMRFNNITIPQGANITNAYIEFEVDETSSEATNLTFFGEDIDNSVIFDSINYNISNRTKTTASVNWNNVPAWSVISEKKQTPDLSVIIQEIVNRPGWLDSNSLSIIVTGSGKRTAEAYNGESANAPVLNIDYTTPGYNTKINPVTNNFEGWAWNGNADGSGIGWISFSHINCDTDDPPDGFSNGAGDCPVAGTPISDYKVHVGSLLTVPNPPIYISTTAIGCDSIQMSWTDNSNNEDFFETQWSNTGGAGSWTAHGPPDLDPGTEIKTVAQTEGTTRYYRVASKNAAGTSTWAPSDNGDSINLGYCPPVLTVDADNPPLCDTIELSWTYGNNLNVTYQIERNVDSTGWVLLDPPNPLAHADPEPTLWSDSDNIIDTSSYQYRINSSDGNISSESSAVSPCSGTSLPTWKEVKP